MRMAPAKRFAAGCIGALLSLQALRAQEATPVVLVNDNDRFLYSVDTLDNLYVSGHPSRDANAPKADFGLNHFGITLQTLPHGTTEVPEVKMEFHGTRYVLPARKIIVVPTPPKQQGVFAQVARDPNGTGNYEVMLTVNWPDWPDHEKQIEFLSNLLPKGMEVLSNGGGWGYPNGGFTWRRSLIFHNRTSQSFILDGGYFENLPTNEGWPEIVIPPAN